MAYLRGKLPSMEVCTEEGFGIFPTFVESFRRQGMDAAVHIEDDIILTRDFVPKMEAVIAEHPKHIVQMFSIRKVDLAEGSRWDRDYMMNQCFYVPAGYGPQIVQFAEAWVARHPRRGTGRINPREDFGNDCMLRDFLKARREAYWLHVPSLVQHRSAKSRLGPRSTKRQSPTFVDPDE
jgi:hypothetical protein